MIRKKIRTAPNCPLWMVSYGDMMGLLAAFFVMLAAMSTVNKPLFRSALTSIQDAFGIESGRSRGAGSNPARPTMFERLGSLVMMKQVVPPDGQFSMNDMDGCNYRAQSVRGGLRIAGGDLEFESGVAQPRAVTGKAVARLAQELRGHTTKIEVLGHASDESLPAGAPFRDLTDLSYARAKAVGDLLAKNGVEPYRIRLMACGEAEPLLSPVGRGNDPARNRRVDILVTEVLVSDPSSGAAPRPSQ